MTIIIIIYFSIFVVLGIRGHYLAYEIKRVMNQENVAISNFMLWNFPNIAYKKFLKEFDFQNNKDKDKEQEYYLLYKKIKKSALFAYLLVLLPILIFLVLVIFFPDFGNSTQCW